MEFYKTDSITLHKGDSVEVLKTLPDNSVNAIITDPPYPCINRDYGKLTESDWHNLMRQVCKESQRVLKPEGSAVYILQPNSRHIGSIAVAQEPIAAGKMGRAKIDGTTICRINGDVTVGDVVWTRDGSSILRKWSASSSSVQVHKPAGRVIWHDDSTTGTRDAIIAIGTMADVEGIEHIFGVSDSPGSIELKQGIYRIILVGGGGGKGFGGSNSFTDWETSDGATLELLLYAGGQGGGGAGATIDAIIRVPETRTFDFTIGEGGEEESSGGTSTFVDSESSSLCSLSAGGGSGGGPAGDNGSGGYGGQGSLNPSAGGTYVISALKMKGQYGESGQHSMPDGIGGRDGRGGLPAYQIATGGHYPFGGGAGDASSRDGGDGILIITKQPGY